MKELPEGYSLQQAWNDILHLAERQKETEDIVDGLFSLVAEYLLIINDFDWHVRRYAWSLFLRFQKANPSAIREKKISEKIEKALREDNKGFQLYILSEISSLKGRKVDKKYKY